MSKIKCIIIEDEPLAVKLLSDYISQVQFLKLQGKFKDALLAAEYLRDNEVDLIFLDIHLPKFKGMDFLKTLVNPPAVIITTAYHQYAVEGFNLSVTDYLLKPFDFSRFLTAVNKVKSRGKNSKPDDTSARKDFIFLNVQKKKVKIQFAELLYIESQKEYVKLVTTKHVYLSKISTNEIEKILPSNLFKRIHRSFIVSLNRIDSYNSESVEINGVSLPIGRDYRGVLENL
jgi:two-component system, LytTR family, response regulator